MKRDASPGSMHDAGYLGLVHWDDPEGWCGEGGGRRVQDGEHMKKKKKKTYFTMGAQLYTEAIGIFRIIPYNFFQS